MTDGNTSQGWASTRRGRMELAAAGLFCTLNLVVPLVITDLYPFSRAPMFADAPRQYCDFTVLGPDGETLDPALFGLQRNYWGNPIGVGTGYRPPATLDRFGSVPTEAEVREHVSALLFPQLRFVTVQMTVYGPIDSTRVGIQSETRFVVAGATP